ncbi:MAG TPA: hypothetical protein V6C69_18035 [Trichormus sp.]|jgi:hypothetical protein
MRSKEKEKTVELKCAGECEPAADVDGADPASTDCAGSSEAETGSEVISCEPASAGTANLDQRPHFPAPTGIARLKWLTGAVLLCAIFAGAGVFLLKWRHEPAYKLTLQTSYTEMNEYHRVREAILLAQLAMREAKYQHVAEQDLAPINAQLRYLYMQRYLDRQRRIKGPHQHPYGGRFRKYYSSPASHFANIAPQKPASATK